MNSAYKTEIKAIKNMLKLYLIVLTNIKLYTFWKFNWYWDILQIKTLLKSITIVLETQEKKVFFYMSL